MTNPKGTQAESAFVKWAKEHGFLEARRIARAGALDKGDVWLNSDWIAEVKNYAGGAAVGQPGEAQLTKWLKEAEAERLNADAKGCLLVVKRKGTTNPGKWWAYLPTSVTFDRAAETFDPQRWACFTVETILTNQGEPS